MRQEFSKSCCYNKYSKEVLICGACVGEILHSIKRACVYNALKRIKRKFFRLIVRRTFSLSNVQGICKECDHDIHECFQLNRGKERERKKLGNIAYHFVESDKKYINSHPQSSLPPILKSKLLSTHAIMDALSALAQLAF